MNAPNGASVKAVVDDLYAAHRQVADLPPDPQRDGAHLAGVAALLEDTLPVPGVDPIERARVALSLMAVHGVDINPYAVAIARFRLIVEAERELGLSGQRIDDDQVPPEIGEIIRRNVGWGDSLLPADDPRQPFVREVARA
jgi:hypothetical protein